MVVEETTCKGKREEERKCRMPECEVMDVITLPKILVNAANTLENIIIGLSTPDFPQENV